MKTTLKKAKEAKCPICGKAMMLLFPNEISYREGHTTHSFSCICGVKWTAWDLTITGLKKEHDRIEKKRAEEILKKFTEFKLKKNKKRGINASN